jgi:hypothetical protein
VHTQGLGAQTFWTTVASALADNEFDAGDPETALSLTLDVLSTYRSLNSAAAVPGIASSVSNMAAYFIALGRYDEARASASEALELAHGLRYAEVVTKSLETLSLAVLLHPDLEGPGAVRKRAGAARIFGLVDARRTMLGISDVHGLRHQRDWAFTTLRDAIGADQFTRLLATGATMTEGEAIAEAHALE